MEGQTSNTAPRSILTNSIKPEELGDSQDGLALDISVPEKRKSQNWRHWKFFVTLAIPILLSPLLRLKDGNGIAEKKFQCAYVVLLMIFSWMLELLPIGVTSLLPFIMFPTLGIMDSAQVSRNYVKETTVLFVGGIIIALAVEYCNLHRRIALKIMQLVGCSPGRLLFGTMMTTSFLSMWINNTATAGMAIPIVSATVEEIFPLVVSKKRRRRKSVYREVSESDLEMENEVNFYIGNRLSSSCPDPSELQKKNMKKMLYLSICMAANIGGTAVVTGSASNLIFQELMKSLDVSQGGKYMDISFATWSLYNLPTVLLNLLGCWFYLLVYFHGCPQWLWGFWKKPSNEERERLEEERERYRQTEQILQQKYRDLGPMTFHELTVLILFIATILLWFLRNPGFMRGWEPYLPTVQESTVALVVIFLFFIIPRFGEPSQSAPLPKSGALLDWKYVQDSLPWGLVLLLGGGFAMSEGIIYSGLSTWLSAQLMYLDALPKLGLLLVLLIFTVACTSVASNSATASTLLALLIPLSRSLDFHPLFLTLPVTVACSYAFLLPISTPPNALVYQAAGGELSVREMVKVMALPNVLCVFSLFLFHISYGNFLFHFDVYMYSNTNVTQIPLIISTPA